MTRPPRAVRRTAPAPAFALAPASASALALALAPARMARRGAALAVALIAGTSAAAAAAAPAVDAAPATTSASISSPPDTLLHVQVARGAATDTVAIGARRALGWQVRLGGLVLSAHGELEVGRWRVEQASGARLGLTQTTLAPVLQLEGGRWFGEVGVGPTWLTPVYRSRQRAFSSRLQFRDHLALGARFGAQGEHTLDVRLVHVSNGSLDTPNPGLELVGVRYARRW